MRRFFLGSHGQFFWHLFSPWTRLACLVVGWQTPCCQGRKKETTMSPSVPEHREGIRPSIDALWGVTEFAEAEFGDSRFTRRGIQGATDCMAQPQGSIPQARGDWAATTAAYRLFAHPKGSAARILAPPQWQTCCRIAGESRILAVQETGFLNDTSHPTTRGPGLIGAERDGQPGLLRPTTLAMTPEGVLFGILTQESWPREAVDATLEAATRRVKRRPRPLEANESRQWFHAVQQVHLRGTPRVELVTVCDREATSTTGVKTSRSVASRC